jgi:hypothetical protein
MSTAKSGLKNSCIRESNLLKERKEKWGIKK